MQVIGVNKHSFVEVLLHVCVLDCCVQTCFLTVGLSLGSWKHADLRPWAPCLAPCVARLLLLFLLCLASSYFHAVFPLCCFPVCLHPASARSPHSHCSPSGGSKTRLFFFNFYFFKIMYLSYVAQEKSIRSIMQHLTMLI